MFGTGLLSLVLFAELGFVGRSGPLPIDTTVAEWFKNHRTPREIHWAQVISALTTPLLVFMIAITLLLFANYWARSWYPRDFVPLALIGSCAVIATVAKPFFGRVRPGAGLTTLFEFEPGYPSSHVAFLASAGSALVIYSMRRQFLIFILVGVASFGLSLVRLVLGVHWVTDVIGSQFLAFGLLIIFYAVDDWLAERESAQL